MNISCPRPNKIKPKCSRIMVNKRELHLLNRSKPVTLKSLHTFDKLIHIPETTAVKWNLTAILETKTSWILFHWQAQKSKAAKFVSPLKMCWKTKKGGHKGRGLHCPGLGLGAHLQRINGLALSRTEFEAPKMQANPQKLQRTPDWVHKELLLHQVAIRFGQA